jgi:hypothetical protein
MELGRYDTQHNDTEHIGLVYDTQHYWTFSITMLCIMLSAFTVMLSVFMLRVVTLEIDVKIMFKFTQKVTQK